jgi:ElaB/YqjD/DUF883 family membrane-anchored ribosome-binding protein
MFDALKKAKALEELGHKAGEVVEAFLKLDADNNGIADFKENLDDLKALPALIKKEGSEVAHEAEDAREKIQAALLRIGGRFGEDIELIQSQCAKQISDIEKRLKDLQK